MLKPSPLNCNDLENYASFQRLSRYRSVCSSDDEILRLYRANLRISMSFYPLLSLLETFLRNQIDSELTISFVDPDWILNQRYSSGFMTRRPNCYMASKVTAAEDTLRNRGTAITAAKVLAEQSLNFWTLFFRNDYYRLVRGRVIRCFPNRPRATIQRSDIHSRLERIRRLRNRIYHNEPICFGTNCVDFSTAEQVHIDILELFEWIDPRVRAYAESFDQVVVEIAAYPLP